MNEVNHLMVQDLQAQNKLLQARIQELEGRYSQAAKNHHFDIGLIGETLMREADDRGWCDAYDEVIDRLNEKLYVELPTRTKEYDVTVTYTVVMRKTVEAKSEEDAQEDAEAEFSNELNRVDNLSSFDCQEDWEFDES
jgi:hypothetical protein